MLVISIQPHTLCITLYMFWWANTPDIAGHIYTTAYSLYYSIYVLMSKYSGQCWSYLYNPILSVLLYICFDEQILRTMLVISIQPHTLCITLYMFWWANTPDNAGHIYTTAYSLYYSIYVLMSKYSGQCWSYLYNPILSVLLYICFDEQILQTMLVISIQPHTLCITRYMFWWANTPDNAGHIYTTLYSLYYSI